MHGSHGDAAGELSRPVPEGQDGLNKTIRYSRTLGPQAKERAGWWREGGCSEMESCNGELEQENRKAREEFGKRKQTETGYESSEDARRVPRGLLAVQIPESRGQCTSAQSLHT